MYTCNIYYTRISVPEKVINNYFYTHKIIKLKML